MTQIIITDLTRFSTREKVCTAGIDIQTGECIRPMPYLKNEYCQKLNILPGSILSGTFTKPPTIDSPHCEDRFYKDMEFIGPCTSERFYQILKNDLVKDIGTGFEIVLAKGQKSLPAGHKVSRSIITIQINPTDIEIIKDQYKPGKIKANFQDQSRHKLSYVPIADLGFHDYAMDKHGIDNLDSLNDFLQSQQDVFLRIGLGREWKGAYWMQLNGIYTFPDYSHEIRSY